MSKPKPITPDIGKVFADGRAIDEAIRMSVHQALLEHKLAGNPIAVGQWNGLPPPTASQSCQTEDSIKQSRGGESR
jgi:hypothetical protein